MPKTNYWIMAYYPNSLSGVGCKQNTPNNKRRKIK